MKKVVLISLILVCLAQKKSFAQTANDFLNKFTHSLLYRVNYPDTLIDACASSVSLMKITVNKKMKITDITLSNSTNPVYAKHFLKNVGLLDTASLYQYLKSKKTINAVLLMPMYISVQSNACTTKQVRVDQLRNFAQFGKTDLTGNVILLPPFYFPMMVEVINN
jgi:hypothetical protein